MARPICKGTAGVKGPAQKIIMAVNKVHHHSLIVNANMPVTTQGDQNINSAIINANSISLFKTVLRNHAHNFFSFCFIVRVLVS